jgi:ribose 5-phosphate isomerase B
MRIYFASDHAGFALKNVLIEFVTSLDYKVADCGVYTLDPNDDYPPFVAKVAKAVSESDGKARGIIIGGSGQGEAMVANRFRGVRAAVYYGCEREQTDASGKTLDVITSSREHNDANILSLGARFLSKDEAKAAVQEWLATPFAGEERHQRRIQQIEDYAGK